MEAEKKKKVAMVAKWCPGRNGERGLRRERKMHKQKNGAGRRESRRRGTMPPPTQKPALMNTVLLLKYLWLTGTLENFS